MKFIFLLIQLADPIPCPLRSNSVKISYVYDLAKPRQNTFWHNVFNFLWDLWALQTDLAQVSGAGI